MSVRSLRAALPNERQLANYGEWVEMWRNTALPVRVLMLDARACLPVLCFVCYWSWTTFYIALIGTLFFGTISFLGLTVAAMMRLTRRLIVGPVRPAVPV